MCVVVWGMSGQVVTKAAVAEHPTAGSLRRHLATARGFPVEAVRLSSGDAELADDHSFSAIVTGNAATTGLPTRAAERSDGEREACDRDVTVVFAAPEVTAEALFQSAFCGYSGHVTAILDYASASVHGFQEFEELLCCGALAVAADQGHEACVAALLQAASATGPLSALAEHEPTSASATQQQCQHVIRHMLFGRDASGGSTLHCAARRGNENCLQALLDAATEAGTHVQEELLLTGDRFRQTALHRACEARTAGCVKALLSAAARASPAAQEELVCAEEHCSDLACGQEVLERVLAAAETQAALTSNPEHSDVDIRTSAAGDLLAKAATLGIGELLAAFEERDSISGSDQGASGE